MTKPKATSGKRKLPAWATPEQGEKLVRLLAIDREAAERLMALHTDLLDTDLKQLLPPR